MRTVFSPFNVMTLGEEVIALQINQIILYPIPPAPSSAHISIFFFFWGGGGAFRVNVGGDLTRIYMTYGIHITVTVADTVAVGERDAFLDQSFHQFIVGGFRRCVYPR